MMFQWFNAREATEIGAALAEQFVRQIGVASTTSEKRQVPKEPDKVIQQLLHRADQQIRTLRLNTYKRAKFAHSFRWKLLESGFDGSIADEVTRSLVLQLSLNEGGLVPGQDSVAASAKPPKFTSARHLFAQGNKHVEQGEYTEAIGRYQELVRLHPRHADGLNNLGSALCRFGRYEEAEEYFHRAIRIKPNHSEAHCNLGLVYRWRGNLADSEASLRRALKINPSNVDARVNLGLILILIGRLRDAKACFEKVLKTTPRHPEALYGLGQIAGMDGRFDDAEVLFKRVLEVNPKMTDAWAGLASLRKMTQSDAIWRDAAEKLAVSGVAPLEESSLRFAIGKYWDDVEDYAQAFPNFKRANELLKDAAAPYNRELRTRFVDGLIGIYTRETICQVGEGASTSMKPVFVVGMMRSGTSLVEQIIASHPGAKGAGELPFWGEAMHEHAAVVRQGLIDEPVRKKLAEDYLRVLAGYPDALRVVDKAPLNFDHLGVIHSVFPNARIIYMRRDPIDTCLSCYFQQFSTALNFTMDLSDLTHYYKEHHRIMAHWRAVLPTGTILDVPYAELVADPAGWTRRMLNFVGLEWDERCLDFYKTQRRVATASSWQVRQKIYKSSVERWRNYEKFIRPLLSLRDLDP